MYQLWHSVLPQLSTALAGKSVSGRRREDSSSGAWLPNNRAKAKLARFGIQLNCHVVFVSLQCCNDGCAAVL